jgi:signal peptidase
VSAVPRVLGPVLLAVAAVAVVVVGVCGVRLLPVLTGSMAPSAPAGSLVVTVPVAGEDVAVGDVLAFRPPAPYEVVDDRPLLHRVVEVGTDADQPWMTTRGDANAEADPWRVSLHRADLGRAVLVVPYAGRPLAGGPWAAAAFVCGGAALAGAVRAVRRPRCNCPAEDGC